MNSVDLRLYLDESGHSSSHPMTVIAGFMGRASAWSGFSHSWNQVLKKYGVRSPFHMTDFEAKKGQFQGWDEHTQRRPLMAALMREITSRPLLMIGAAMSTAAWNEIDWSVYHEFEPLEDPYHLAMQDVLGVAVGCASETDPRGAAFAGDTISTVIAKQGEFGGAADGYYRALAALGGSGKLAGAASFADQVECPQLQAADIAAFEFRWKITRPDLNRFPWMEIANTGRVSVYLRGFPGLDLFPNVPRVETQLSGALILRQKNSKSKVNQGKRRRPAE